MRTNPQPEALQEFPAVALLLYCSCKSLFNAQPSHSVVFISANVETKPCFKMCVQFFTRIQKSSSYRLR